MEATRNTLRLRHKARMLTVMGVFPAVIYLGIFFVVTYPLMLQFSTHFFTDKKDGLVMIWNIWWTRTAVTELHQSPWHTSYLYHPYGVSLLAHTLCPFNGFLATILHPFLTLKQTYNLIVVFTFVMGGLTTFWLSFYLIRSYWPSIAAGFIFGFSNFHFAHTPGHLNLASLEWIPLFVLCWYAFIKNPGALLALASAATLFAVMLCDYSYFSYCVLVAVTILSWHALGQKTPRFLLTRRYIINLSVFAAATLASSGVIALKLLRMINSSSLYGAHDPSEYPTDLLSPFFYGARLRFSQLTEGFWPELQGNTSETSVYVGLSVLILIAYGWLSRRRIAMESLRLWYVLLIFFLLASLGPTLYVWGKRMPFEVMPYRLLERVFPWFSISGMPSRMMVIVMLCAALTGAAALELLFRGSGKSRFGAAVLIVFLAVEYLPQRLPSFGGEAPEWVIALRDSPSGAVIDARGDPYGAMYYQTIHGKPIWGGFVARISTNLMEKNERINKLVEELAGEELRDKYGFRYAVTGSGETYDLTREQIIFKNED
jgi:hypothetical protein